MKYPEVLLIPVLMILDYLLTIYGARLSDQTYRQHFKTPDYELNPMWQQQVRSRSWFNPRHLLLVLLLSMIIVGGEQFLLFMNSLVENKSDTPPGSWQLPELLECVNGLLLGMFAIIIGRHLGNVLLFHYLNRHPQLISGEVKMAQVLVLRLSQVQLISVIAPLSFLALMTRSTYVVGATSGSVAVFIVHEIWRLKADRIRIASGGPRKEAARDVDTLSPPEDRNMP